MEGANSLVARSLEVRERGNEGGLVVLVEKPLFLHAKLAEFETHA